MFQHESHTSITRVVTHLLPNRWSCSVNDTAFCIGTESSGRVENDASCKRVEFDVSCHDWMVLYRDAQPGTMVCSYTLV